MLAEKLEKADNTLITAEELQKELDNLKAEAMAKETNPIKVTYNKTGNTYKIDLSKGEISKVEVNPNMVSFSIIGDEDREGHRETAFFEVDKGTTWEKFLQNNNNILGARPGSDSIYKWSYNKNTNQVCFINNSSTTAEVYYYYPLKNSSGEEVLKDMEINAEQYYLDTAIDQYDYDIDFGDEIDF